MLWGLNSSTVKLCRQRRSWPAMIEHLLLLLALVGTTVRDRGDLVVENLLPRQQIAVLTRPTRKRPRRRAPDKLFWVLTRLVRRAWRRHPVLVTPETVLRWHRRGWRLYWRWRSRAPIGRPRVSVEVRVTVRADFAAPTWRGTASASAVTVTVPDAGRSRPPRLAARPCGAEPGVQPASGSLAARGVSP
jgi:hypothetical protein